MIFTVYTPLEESGGLLTGTLVTGFTEAEKYECRKHWREIGSFSLTVPVDTPGISLVKTDMILYADEDGENDSLIITGVEKDGDHVTLTGTDLKGMLGYRVTLFPQAETDAGTYGYDVRQGSTGDIIAGYITYNCIEPSDPRRKLPGLRIGNTYGGISADTYMSRLQPVSDVAIKMCENADVGWDITFAPSAVDAGYRFDIIAGADRTNATGSSKCIFALCYHNSDKITRHDKTADRRNVIWTINGGDTDDAVVIAVYRSQVQDEISGFSRRETVMTASCDADLVDAYVRSKSADMTDKTEIGFRLADPSMYGKAFRVGDKVTAVVDGEAVDRRVIEINKSYSAGERSVSVKLSDIPVQKAFERVSASLAERADDVKELALETASVKKKQYTTFYSATDPADDEDATVKPGDYWMKLTSENDMTVTTRYRRDRVPVSSGTSGNEGG